MRSLLRAGSRAIAFTEGLSLAVPATAFSGLVNDVPNYDFTELGSLDIRGRCRALDGSLPTRNAVFDITPFAASRIHLTGAIDPSGVDSTTLSGRDADCSTAASLTPGAGALEELADDTSFPRFRTTDVRSDAGSNRSGGPQRSVQGAARQNFDEGFLAFVAGTA